MDPARLRAVELARALLTGDAGTEAEQDAMAAEFATLVPDPDALSLIFWPKRHPLSADLDETELTAELVVELAHRYEPFAL